MIEPFGMIEIALKEVVARWLDEPLESTQRVGGDLSFNAETDDFYVWIGLVPGATADATGGSWIVDIDVFGKGYVATMRRSLALDAALLRPGGHRTEEMLIDSVTQNVGPTERPWDDEAVFRIGGTYVLTARRSG